MNEFSLMTNRIEDNRQEKIAFIIDLSDEILREDFVNFNGEKVERIKILFDEISNFIKLKDYFSSRPTEFALYIYTDKLRKEIGFCEVKEFDIMFNQMRNNAKNFVIEPNDYLDLAQIFKEATGNLNLSGKANEVIYRYILFYNRSDIPATNSNDREYNTMTFIRLSNFFFDVVFMRRKINADEDKRILNEVYNSLTSVKPKFWYAMEVSGNLNKFKFLMNLLLANANQRVKISDVDKFQKGVEEIVKNYTDN